MIHKHTHTPSPQRVASLTYLFLSEKGKRVSSWPLLEFWVGERVCRRQGSTPLTLQCQGKRGGRETRKREREREREEWEKKGRERTSNTSWDSGRSDCPCAREHSSLPMIHQKERKRRGKGDGGW